jgi:hypothetical protein
VLTDSLDVGGLVSGISYLATGCDVPNVDQVAWTRSIEETSTSP